MILRSPFPPSLVVLLSCALLSLGAGTGCRTGRGERDWERSDRRDRDDDRDGEEETDRAERGIHEEELRVGRGTFTLRARNVDRDAFDQVLQSVRNAGRELERWGDFRDPVEIVILPDPARFDEAVGEGRFPGRRGFARYDQVFLLSPAAWSPRGARDAELGELVLHELTHALMYQHASNRTGWRRKGIPFWFREGMASYTARQAYRWKEPSRDLYHEGRAPFREEREDERGEADEADRRPERGDVQTRYGLAHYAFDALLARGGERKVRALLEEMEDGSAFDEAFEQTYREPVPEFIAKLERTLPEGH